MWHASRLRGCPRAGVPVEQPGLSSPAVALGLSSGQAMGYGSDPAPARDACTAACRVEPGLRHPCAARADPAFQPVPRTDACLDGSRYLATHHAAAIPVFAE